MNTCIEISGSGLTATTAILIYIATRCKLIGWNVQNHINSKVNLQAAGIWRYYRFDYETQSFDMSFYTGNEEIVSTMEEATNLMDFIESNYMLFKEVHSTITLTKDIIADIQCLKECLLFGEHKKSTTPLLDQIWNEPMPKFTAKLKMNHLGNVSWEFI